MMVSVKRTYVSDISSQTIHVKTASRCDNLSLIRYLFHNLCLIRLRMLIGNYINIRGIFVPYEGHFIAEPIQTITHIVKIIKILISVWCSIKIGLIGSLWHLKFGINVPDFQFQLTFCGERFANMLISLSVIALAVVSAECSKYRNITGSRVGMTSLISCDFCVQVPRTKSSNRG